jgi:hypothetical protein
MDQQQHPCLSMASAHLLYSGGSTYTMTCIGTSKQRTYQDIWLLVAVLINVTMYAGACSPEAGLS